MTALLCPHLANPSSLYIYCTLKERPCSGATEWWHKLNYAGVGLVLLLDQAIYPINIMRMNQRVVLFLMVCNGMSADSVIALALLAFLITWLPRPCPTTIVNPPEAIISDPYYWPAFNEENNHQSFKFNENSHLLKSTDWPQRQTTILKGSYESCCSYCDHTWSGKKRQWMW